MALFNEEEEAAFYSQDSDRAMAIMYGTMLENRLTDLIFLYLRPDKKVRNELFHPSGALGNFGVKIRLAYMMGILLPIPYSDLLIINKIRNAFAHKLGVTDFNKVPIDTWINDIEQIKALRKEVAGHAGSTDKFGRVFHIVLSQKLSDSRGAYQEAVRLLMHYLTMACNKLIELGKLADERRTGPLATGPPETPS